MILIFNPDHFIKRLDYFIKKLDLFIKRIDYFIKRIDYFIKRIDYFIKCLDTTFGEVFLEVDPLNPRWRGFVVRVLIR